jgi:hypothetical protein
MQLLTVTSDIPQVRLHPITTNSLERFQREAVTASFPKCLVDSCKEWPIQVNYSPEKGLFLTATQNIQPGDAVLKELPSVAAICDQYVKSNCGKCFRTFSQDRLRKISQLQGKTSKGTHNGHKSTRGFVCKLCEDSHIAACDQVTCYDLISDKEYFIDGLWTRFFQRALLLGNFTHASKLVSLPATCASWLLPGKVISDLDKTTDKEIEEMTEFLIDVYSMEVDSKLSLDLMQKLAYNCHAIAGQDHLKNTILGIANFPLASLINHSCDPNLHWTAEAPSVLDAVNDPVWIGEAKTEIKAGEELTISYGPTIGTSHSKRQKRLLEGFFFRCFCAACLDVCWKCQKKAKSLKRCPGCRVWDACDNCFGAEHACKKWDALEKLCHEHA